MMKTLIAPTLFALAIVGVPVHGTIAADHDTHGSMQAPVDVPLVEGLVKKVDKPAGKVTLSHGPLPNGMPGMTMAFRVKEALWLDQMKEGRKIRFAADEVNGVMTVIRFEPEK
ncbi:Periplasmic copper-binding protein [Gammaproteobacteria bacterium]